MQPLKQFRHHSDHELEPLPNVLIFLSTLMSRETECLASKTKNTPPPSTPRPPNQQKTNKQQQQKRNPWKVQTHSVDVGGGVGVKRGKGNGEGVLSLQDHETVWHGRMSNYLHNGIKSAVGPQIFYC